MTEPHRSDQGRLFDGLDQDNGLGRFIRLLAIGVGWLCLSEMIFVRVFDIVGRQFWKTPSVWFQFLEWAFFWLLIILTVGFAYLKNSHVRIDIIRDRLSVRGRAILELLGIVFLLLPFLAVVTLYGWEFIYRSFADGERSGALLGTHSQWIFKFLMNFGLFLLMASALLIASRCLEVLRERPSPPSKASEGDG